MSSKFSSVHFSNTNGTTRALLNTLLGVSPDEPTATVWNHIESTADNYPGTTVPRSFTVDTPSGKFWTHGNATEHMNEAVIALRKVPGLEQSNPNLFTQFVLYDYRKSLSKATENGVKLNRMIKSGHWEFKLAKKAKDKHPVVIHAMFTGMR